MVTPLTPGMLIVCFSHAQTGLTHAQFNIVSRLGRCTPLGISACVEPILLGSFTNHFSRSGDVIHPQLRVWSGNETRPKAYSGGGGGGSPDPRFPI